MIGVRNGPSPDTSASSKSCYQSISIDLQSLPRQDGFRLPADVLSSKVYADNPSRRDLWRTRFGRALNLDRIEGALQSADYGSMQMLTDLSRETIDTDPHLASILNKRFGSISALPYDVIPAQGIGIDDNIAMFFADLVRQQIAQLAAFGQRIHQLAWGLFDGRSALENQWALVPNLPGMKVITHPTLGPARWQIRELGWIHPRRLQFGPKRELRISDEPVGSFSESGLALQDWPLKFIQFMPQLFGDYQEREGLSRRSLYWSFFKRFSARERMVLMELFGKPWRWLEVDEDSSADRDDLAAADGLLQSIGSSASFRFPRGTRLKLAQPDKGAGEIHQQVIEESDKQLSKLILGQTGTTDSAPAGLNNIQANVMQNEQLLILMRDARMISEALETGLTDKIIELNYGAQWLNHAPRFALRPDLPLDRGKELERLKSAIDAGLEVAIDQAYEISGFRRPKVTDTVIKIDTPQAHPLAVQPPTERAMIAYAKETTKTLPERVIQPISQTLVDGSVLPVSVEEEKETTVSPAAAPAPAATPVVSTLNVNPSDIARVVTVNEVRSAQGLPPLVRDGARDPDGDLTIEEFSAKRAAVVETLKAPPVTHGLPTTEPVTSTTEELTAAMALFIADAPVEDRAFLTCMFSNAATTCVGCGVHLEAGEQEETPHNAPQPIESDQVGSVEGIVTKGQKEGAVISEKMVMQIVAAVEGKVTARAINKAIEQAGEEANLQPFSRAMERRIAHSAMSGALASTYEVQTGDALPVATFAKTLAFTEKPFAEAVKIFKSLNIFTRAEYEQLEIDAKRRAFTIAGALNTQQVEIAKNELLKVLQEGADLGTFKGRLSERYTSAGFTTSNPSHVETVYRTNIVNANNSGRHRQMTQPGVLRMRPYWQIRTVNDGPPRQRITHKAVHEWVIRADDEVWKRIYPPFGFNCRCRVTSLSELEVQDKGLKVRSGGEVKGLPDPGFVGGSKTLL